MEKGIFIFFLYTSILAFATFFLKIFVFIIKYFKLLSPNIIETIVYDGNILIRRLSGVLTLYLFVRMYKKSKED